MKPLRLFSGPVGIWIFVLFIGTFLTTPLFSQAIIIDHNCTDISLIPGSWINAAKNALFCSYGHTSHGSQLITGMTALMNDPGSGNLYNFNTNGAIQVDVLSIADYTPSGDLGNPNRTEWEASTRAYLNGAGSDRNVVMWSWCGQVSSATQADINTYLTLMDGLEQDYPGVTFVYMTGHLDGTGASGNLHVRNNQIRAWCLANNKVLFDFADIESYDPDGNYFLNLGANDACNYSGGNWADEWIAANPDSELAKLAAACGSCAHSRRLNCILKGRAAWWLFARIAGWDGNTTSQPSITVKSPNGGEDWTVDSSHTITWTTTGIVGNVKIEYSTDNSGSWATVIASTANDGAYNWNIPDSPSDQCLVKISEIDGSPSDTSNTVFTISEPGQTPTITLTSPNGGEEWKVGSLQTITWTTTGTVGNVMIKYSKDNGGSWSKITASTANDGSFDWTIPNTPSTKCLVKVCETDGSPTDISDAVFTISDGGQTGTITLKSPNGGEEWKVGSLQTITWTTTGTVGNVMIKYSKDNGGSWSKITASTANDGSFDWTIPNTPSTKCLVKVCECDGGPWDTSDAVFTITDGGQTSTIKVTSPNGGEVWEVGSKQTITWTTTGTVGNVMIKYSKNKGGSWSTITASTANDGSYQWTIPNTPSTKCLVKIFEKDYSPLDVSDAVFTISDSGQTGTIEVTSPNGGEEWEVGSKQTITWTNTGNEGKVSNTGNEGKVKIEYSVDGGINWSKIMYAYANEGACKWTVPNNPSEKCLVKISEADGNASDVSDTFFSIIPSSEKPKIYLNREKFNFGYIIGGKVPKSQRLHIFNCGGGTLEWTSSANAQWLTLEPGSGTGPAKVEVVVDPTDLAPGYYTGTITITDPNAVNSPLELTVNLKVKEKSEGKCPFGSFDTPLSNTVVSGSIPVTGWALDDVEIDNVKIYREKNGELKYIGDAVFVEGARPDVENSYPEYPCNYKAGWGYMLLTNCLSNHGNGKLVLHIIASDCSGNVTTLGTKTITVDNINAKKPFGALDSPTQGGSASGSGFINWGWALTPPPHHIPTNGSTIKVYVDGVYLGNPHFNIYRSDIADFFPNYSNCNGAAGYFVLDTTSYENGVHTIQWTVKDNAGNTDGIGSRYFTIENNSPNTNLTALPTQLSQPQDNPVRVQGFAPYLPLKPSMLPVDYSRPLLLKKGYDENVEPKMIYPDNNGIITIEIKELERLELHLSDIFFESGAEQNYYCHRVVGDQLRPLPVGSAFDNQRGVLYWQPGPGFLGQHRFVLLVENQNLEVMKKEILIKINPRVRGKEVKHN